MLFRPEMETDLVNRQLEQHVASALNAKELSSNPDRIRLLVTRRRRLTFRREFGPYKTVQGRGKVDVRCCLLLYGLNDAAFAGRHEVVQLDIDLDHV